MNPNTARQADPRTSTTANPPPARTDAERQARQAEENRRHAENVQRRALAMRREEAALAARNAPESARESVRRWHRRTPAEERDFAKRRDKLHAALDALGDRVPSDADLFELVACARATFPPYQASARILAALARHPAVQAVLAREDEEPEYKGDAVM